ncbi:MAG: pyrimidine 5'-nucleotidase [Chloroflexota bacterium]|nr:MAG: pyrimidine 5'-nucleotidase [Chloroflexota bacterium]
MRYTTLFFDLDETLYPPGNGLWDAIRDRMNQYMVDRLQLPEEEVQHLRRYYYETYGTTLRGLQRHYNVDASDYLAYVHDLPLQSFLQADSRLVDLLSSLPQRKWIFTNADANHARRVIAALGLSGCFEGIIDVTAIGFACKPEEDAYRLALSIAGESDPSRCLMLDDSARNLAPAKELGLLTILVGSAEPNPAAVYSINTLLELPDILPELWNNNEKSV